MSGGYALPWVTSNNGQLQEAGLSYTNNRNIIVIEKILTPFLIPRVHSRRGSQSVRTPLMPPDENVLPDQLCYHGLVLTVLVSWIQAVLAQIRVRVPELVVTKWLGSRHPWTHLVRGESAYRIKEESVRTPLIPVPILYPPYPQSSTHRPNWRANQRTRINLDLIRVGRGQTARTGSVPSGLPLATQTHPGFHAVLLATLENTVCQH
ncbi:hypothetical protein V1506DRAFT_518860 [Lipomyces tetrasporus]